ncbi:A/G-specific adenine glycosylase [Ruania zhangjianzhongii]|uniref:A/G-specific adenine glycosylase n=1 Tax=Ruania zhangjianzhongii TaxID=2603206 RepID=UPI0011CAB0D0|nr:A/G-specific adenine glycosylase [Ruania zhangjianzhongii]
MTAQDSPDPMALRRPILHWYRDHARDLPWRRPDTSAWGVLVSEVMLQQTPVVRVEPRWREWMTRWPTPADLAAAPTADVLRAWDRLGYPRRALRLREAARAIATEHGGIVPADEQVLRALPGIGDYTAAAVASFAYRRRAVVLDTNVRRVLARAVDGQALPPPSPRRAERERAEALLPRDGAASARWNVAVMELGALVCTARSPRCAHCPIARRCAWVAAGRPADTHADRRRSQAWHGTDRQARGRVMAALREQDQLSAAEVADLWPEPGQRDRILAALVTDGLAEAERDSDGVPLAYRLPAGGAS